MVTVAYSYTRISSPRQEKGQGLERQDSKTEEMAKRYGWTLDESLVLTHIGSSFRGKQLAPTAALGKFMSLVGEGRIPRGSVLIVENLDRISRQETETAFGLFLGLLGAGITIATVMPEQIFKSPLGSAAFTALAEFMRAHSESLVKSGRGSSKWDSRRELARKGVPVTRACPRWLSLSKDRTTWEVDPAKKVVVERIFRDCLNGVGVTQITRALNGEGVAAFETRKRKKGRPVWYSKTVLGILRGRAVLGEYQPGRRDESGKDVPVGDPIPDYYPAVVTETVYWKAQAALDARRQQRGARRSCPNLFTGMIWDAKHQCGLYAATKGHGLMLVSEAGVRVKAERAATPTIHYDRIEQFIMAVVLVKTTPADISHQNGNKLAELSAELTEVDGVIASLEKRLGGPRGNDWADLLERDHYPKRQELREAVQAERVKTVNGAADVLGQLQSLGWQLYGLSGAEQVEMRKRIKARIPQLIREIWLYIGQNETRIAKHRPKACVMEIHYQTGAVQQWVLPWICWPYQVQGKAFLIERIDQLLKGAADTTWAADMLVKDWEDGAHPRWDGVTDERQAHDPPPRVQGISPVGGMMADERFMSKPR